MSAALAVQQCAPRHAALDPAAVAQRLAQVPEWRIEHGRLCRHFAFHNYYQTLAFVNALAFMTHAQDHHPELTVTYNGCTARYTTHSAAGLTDNDFICAARADALYQSAAGRA